MCHTKIQCVICPFGRLLLHSQTSLRTIPTATDNAEDARQRQRVDMLKCCRYIFKFNKNARLVCKFLLQIIQYNSTC